MLNTLDPPAGCENQNMWNGIRFCKLVWRICAGRISQVSMADFTMEIVVLYGVKMQLQIFIYICDLSGINKGRIFMNSVLSSVRLIWHLQLDQGPPLRSCGPGFVGRYCKKILLQPFPTILSQSVRVFRKNA